MSERGEVEEKGLQVALQTCAERDADAVVEYLRGLEDGEVATLLMGTFGVSGYGASGEGATGAFSGGFYGEKSHRTLMAALGERPEIIEEFMGCFEGAEVASEPTNSMLSNLASTDPEGALVLAQAAEGDGNLRSQRIVGVAQAVAESDPQAALELTMQLPEVEIGRRNALSRIGARVGAVDPIAGVAMLEQLKGGEQDTFFYALNFEVAKRDRYKAAELFNAYVIEGGGVERSAGGHAWQLTHTVVRGDPAAALEWAAGLPEGDMRERAVRGVREEWGEIDPPALEVKMGELGLEE